MRLLRNKLLATTLMLAFAGTALAAISNDEAKKLGGPALTEIGAEKAGSKDGTIPPYTGGLKTIPPGYKKGSGRYVDPFANEKPLFSITKENMSKYADKLTPGELALLKQKPGFRMDVYPTHRTAALPEYVEKGTIKAATIAKLSADGNSFSGAVGGFPFPIPRSGSEAMWNHLLHYKGEASVPVNNDIYFVDAAGRTALVNRGSYISEYPYWYRKNPRSVPYVQYKGIVNGPPRQAGQNYLVKDYIDITQHPRDAWMYMVGQRRVRTAPDLSYDAPSPVFAGSITCDDSYVFTGQLDRFNWKLVGKKEIYVPYNCYKMLFESTPESLLKPKFLNPDYVRWELHRVWVVEAKVKPGKRHLYARRTFYLDEDTWAALASDDYDGKEQLYRAVLAYPFQAYDMDASYADAYSGYDFIAGGYGYGPAPFKEGKVYIRGPLPTKEWSPESLATGMH